MRRVRNAQVKIVLGKCHLCSQVGDQIDRACLHSTGVSHTLCMVNIFMLATK